MQIREWFLQKMWDRERWVGALKGLSFRKILVGTGWVISLLICTNRLSSLTL